METGNTSIDQETFFSQPQFHRNERGGFERTFAREEYFHSSRPGRHTMSTLLEPSEIHAAERFYLLFQNPRRYVLCSSSTLSRILFPSNVSSFFHFFLPFKGVYQVSQNMMKAHFQQRCFQIPDEIRAQLISLQQSSKRASSGKQFWVEVLRVHGVYEDGRGLRFRHLRPGGGGF